MIPAIPRQRVRLGDVADLLTGFPFRSSEYTTGDGVRLLRGDNVAQGRLRWDEAKLWPLGLVSDVKNYALAEHDVVVAMDRPWIEAGLKYAAVQRHDLPCLLVQRVARLRATNGTVQRFLKYLIGSRRFTEHVLGVQTGTAVPHISGGQIREFSFDLPPLAEQKAIASILGTLDDKIELNRRMNETLEDLARTIFKSWFVDFDPVRAKAEGRQPVGIGSETAALFPSRFVQSELGKIPEGWRVTRLADLTSKIGSGATPRGGSAVYVDDGVSLIRSQNVYDRRFDWGGLVKLPDWAAEELRGVTVEAHDVLINITGDSILRTCVVDPTVLPARVNQHVSIVRAASGIPPRFLHEHLLLPRTKDWFLGLDTGGTRKAITKGHLESLQLVVPPATVLRSFEAATTSLYHRTIVNSGESKTLAELRDLLLPKLISGELRVPDAEKLIEAAL